MAMVNGTGGLNTLVDRAMSDGAARPRDFIPLED